MSYEEVRNTKMLSFDSLIIAIEELEFRGIITFDEFKDLPYHEIKKRFFAMPNPTMMSKAKTKIEDKKAGKEGYSTHTILTEVYQDGKLIKVEKKTSLF